MDDTGIIVANGHSLDVVTFRRALIDWGTENFRPYPWRLTSDPYRILLAEVMLHRTQARQVVPVYQRFVERFPDILTLAQAEPDELHRELFSLGLRWRIDLIRQMADLLVTHHSGQVPEEKLALLSLPGVSDYIASAVRCFAWNHTEALIDTNTVRVVGRLFALETRDSSRRNLRIKNLISSLVDPLEPKAYNYALLDLADRICSRRHAPLHDICPVQSVCITSRIASI